MNLNFNKENYPLIFQIGKKQLSEIIKYRKGEFNCDCGCNLHNKVENVIHIINKNILSLQDNIHIFNEDYWNHVESEVGKDDSISLNDCQQIISDWVNKKNCGITIIGKFVLFYLINNETEKYFILTDYNGNMLIAAFYDHKLKGIRNAISDFANIEAFQFLLKGNDLASYIMNTCFICHVFDEKLEHRKILLPAKTLVKIGDSVHDNQSPNDIVLHDNSVNQNQRNDD